MSRAIWHFAVVSPSLAEDIARVSCNARDQPQLIEKALCSAVSDSPERAAYFSAVIDGWNGRWLVNQLQARNDEPLDLVLNSLVQSGIAWIPPGMRRQMRLGSASVFRDHNAPGRYAAELIVHGLNNVREFVDATGCVGVILFRLLGSVIGDSEFQKR